MPDISYNYLLEITDDTGTFQHARGRIPWREHGYCSDDVCRALIVAVREGRNLAHLARTNMAFLWDAANGLAGFRNFMSFDRKWLEEKGSVDSQGRVLWSLAVAAKHDPFGFLASPAEELFRRYVDVIDLTEYTRSTAYGLVGLAEFPGEFEEIRLRLVARLVDSYKTYSADPWCWFEPFLSYCNALLCRALIVQPEPEFVHIGLTTLDWLLEHETTPSGFLSPTGSDATCVPGFKPEFAQQPVEVSELSMACLAAYKVTKDSKWLIAQDKCQQWFDGINICNQPMGDPLNGACQDGLERGFASENCGAESTLSYLLTLQDSLEARQLVKSKRAKRHLS